MDDSKARILLVEDDKELAQWTAEYLEGKGYEVQHTGFGQQAIEMVAAHPPALILLDGMLPDVDGLDVCKAVRGQFSGPIIMLTARDEEIDEVLGLEVGADDYITKPVRARALLARIRAHLRKPVGEGQRSQPTARIELSGLVVDKSKREVTLRGNPVSVSSNEFDVLWLLAQQAGQVIARDELVQKLRGFDYDGFDRSVDLRISRLRKKLGDDPANPYLIKTIWGKGYLLVKDQW